LVGFLGWGGLLNFLEWNSRLFFVPKERKKKRFFFFFSRQQKRETRQKTKTQYQTKKKRKSKEKKRKENSFWLNNNLKLELTIQELMQRRDTRCQCSMQQNKWFN
jgi:hypothetical protein